MKINNYIDRIEKLRTDCISCFYKIVNYTSPCLQLENVSKYPICVSEIHKTDRLFSVYKEELSLIYSKDNAEFTANLQKEYIFKNILILSSEEEVKEFKLINQLL